ncbi:MAG: hypothetical protein RLZZ58_1071 [Pseudomonadota bacterium]
MIAARLSVLRAIGRDAMLPAVILAVILFMVVPVPAVLLDVGFIINIMISLAVLMVALGARQVLDFSSFPTVLLFATLLRLALNVASTRVVLVDGHSGSDAAGQVIEAFGHFLIGGDYIVGLFVFAILMIINLVVITKGAGRVSEVSARFTLDALPGKQMAIDADLGAGLMTPEEAKARRAEVATEADFYGSMDGASKFVKGDAVAGVLILIVNIAGGILLGVVSHGMTLGDAAQNYVLLAIGDALVAQVPALLLSIAAAAIVTRVTSPHDLNRQIGGQFGRASAWMPVAAILALLGILPGMPHAIILPIAALCGALAWHLWRDQRRAAASAAAPLTVAPPAPNHIGWDELGDAAGISLDIGFALVPLVDEAKGAPLMARITGVRRQLTRALGFVVPLVRVRDDMTLAPNAYRICIAGVAIAEGAAWPADMLAIDGGDTDPADAAALGGRATKDPSFGVDALWIRPDQRVDAVMAGYTVVDAPTVVATHLNHVIAARAADLFGVDEAHHMVEALKANAPQLAELLVPPAWPRASLAGLCRSLLDDGVSLGDFRTLAEAVAAQGSAAAHSPPALLEAVRRAIGPRLVQDIAPLDAPLPVITLDPELEALVGQAARLGDGGPCPLDPALAQRLIDAVRHAVAAAMGARAALVTTPEARPTLAKLLRPHVADLAVLSFLEIPDAKPVRVIAVVGAADAPAPGGPVPDAPLWPAAEHEFEMESAL